VGGQPAGQYGDQGLHSHADGDSAGSERPADRQVDCQQLELAMFSMDSSERVQAADLVIWTAMDRPEQAGKS
jgi:hypothetical protein